MSQKTAKWDIKRAVRRAKVWELYAKGESQTRIGEQLGVDRSTIARDIADLRDEGVCPDPDVERARIAELLADGIAHYKGETRLRYMDRYCKLLGLDAPAKTDLTSAGQPIQSTATVDLGALLANPETRKALETLSESMGHG